ncbi:MAG: hypothetical protein H6936_14840 [Burkholderiales bacterium]|nr:hypothetical protein [Nitrosomonas sp.]MCP5276088.1 hypothetical protein [Burkholderiales bacterium]
MIELFGWIGLVFSFMSMIYHRYMYSNYDQVYIYIKKKYGGEGGDMKFPSKDDHAKDAKKYSYYTIFFAGLLIIMNFFR